MLAREATAPIRMKSGITESEYALASSNGTDASIFSALRQPSMRRVAGSPLTASATAIGTRSEDQQRAAPARRATPIGERRSLPASPAHEHDDAAAAAPMMPASTGIQ